MKQTNKYLALLLALSLLFSLTACAKSGSGSFFGGKEGSTTEAPKPLTIVGTWRYTIDFEQALASSGESADLSALGAMGEGFADLFKGLSMVVVLDLREDGTFTFSFDEASVKAAVDGMISKMGEILPSLIASMSGMSEEEFMAALAEAGMTMEDLIQQSMAQVNTEDITKELQASSKEGTYRYQDGKLYLTGKDEEEKNDQYLVVELSANELKVVSASENVDFEEFKNFLPMVFTR